LEDNFDHKFLIWKEDNLLESLQVIAGDSLVIVPFNPTAERIAEYLVEKIGPQQLAGYPVKLVSCKVEETAKCSATYNLS